MQTENISIPQLVDPSNESENYLPAQEPAPDGNAKSMSDDETKQINPWIRYYIEWRDPSNVFKSRYEVSGRDAQEDTGDTSHHSLPAFERVSVFWTKNDTETNTVKGKTEEGALSLTGATPGYYLRIYSVAIIHALRSVVQYYPQQDLSGDFIDVAWPYPVLVHHYDELHRFREECAQKEPSDVCIREKYLDKPLRLLLRFLDEEVMDKVNEEKDRNKRGYASFDYLWVSHRPGTTIIHQIAETGEWEARVIYSMHGGIFTQPRQKWTVTMWSMMYNGSHLGRVTDWHEYNRFDGEESFSGLFMMILHEDEFEKVKLENEVVKQAIEYGKAYWNLMVKQCRYHDGLTMNVPAREVQSLIMADLESYYEDEDHPEPDHMSTSDLRDFISDCRCRVCSNKTRTEAKMTSIFEEYSNFNRIDNPELTDHQYLLCPDKLSIFVFKTRTWEKVHVKNLSPPRFQRKMIENLVIDEGRRKTLKSLTESFARLNHLGQVLPQRLWAADFVEEKGNGLIFLLHGGPGVGKTFTAECIAHSLERPLMVLTTSDIGTSPKDVENNLMRNFKTAKRWNAVLLIDEADVFLAQRSISDLDRSSLVASFLRALEFYDGILFLTTNRVGTFDDAILSRVHIQLFYPDFDEDQRYNMWMTFIKKLETDRPSIQIKYAVKEYLRSSEMRGFKMNGREIRNAFQTAVALAEHRAEVGDNDKILLTEEHLREVVELYRSFKMYFSELHGSEGKRALDRGERLDSFIKAIKENF